MVQIRFTSCRQSSFNLFVKALVLCSLLTMILLCQKGHDLIEKAIAPEFEAQFDAPFDIFTTKKRQPTPSRPATQLQEQILNTTSTTTTVDVFDGTSQQEKLLTCDEKEIVANAIRESLSVAIKEDKRRQVCVSSRSERYHWYDLSPGRYAIYSRGNCTRHHC
jgi:hypothetical protein